MTLESSVTSKLQGYKHNVTELPKHTISAVGICEATEVYDGNGPDELSFEAGDRIIIEGLLVTCFEWFMGKLERTGDMGLVKTSLVKATDSLCE